MYRKLSDFEQAFGHRSDATARMMDRLTDASLSQPSAPGHRTLGEIAWHVVVSIPEMTARTGLPLTAVNPREPPPDRAARIQRAYRELADELLRLVRESWSDETLLESDDMYGERWPRGLTLAALIHHETHHTGQMSVLMRQAGLRVPGVYGPAKEEWAAMGMEPPRY